MPFNQPLKVILFSKYSRMGASSRLRSLQYLPELQNANIHVEAFPLFNDKYLELLYTRAKRSNLAIMSAYIKRFLTLLSVFKYDLVWIEYELFPYMPAWAERLMNFLSVKYIVDYDDAVFHNYDLSNSFLVRKLLGKKIDKVMALSTTVIVGNDYLAERARKAKAKSIEVIPTVLDATRYSAVPHSLNKALVIGWIGTPATQHYIIELKPMLEKICITGQCKLVLIGANKSIVTELVGMQVEVLPWQESTEAELIAQFDIGIMPLREGPWENGKCAYKLIQYMACGKPVVASAVGANIAIVENAQCGFLASDHESWLTQINTLVSDAALRLSMGKNGRESVEKVYSLQKQAPRLIKLIREAV